LGPASAGYFRQLMDIIKLSNIVFYAHHGYYKAERELGQRFDLDIEVECDLVRASETDELSDAIDYRKIYSMAKDTFENHKFKLLETVAERIAQQILESFNTNSVLIRVRKPHVPLKGFLDHVEIEIKRTRDDV
jgi:dihydroneopterin aldolase